MRTALACFLSLVAGSATADTLSDIRSSGVLKWGADAVEGGAPYVYLPDPTNEEVYIGFEVDIAEALAEELGVKAKRVQNAWESLVPGLQKGDYDVVINGLEITEERALEVSFSSPYFVSGEQIAVRADTTDISTIDDLRKRPVGTLGGTVAERILQDAGGIDIKRFEAQNTPYDQLAQGQLDAVVMDTPIAVYFGKPNPKLQLVGDSLGECKYGMAIRKADITLLREVNAAIDRMIVSGKLRHIYEDWGIWNQPTADFFKDERPSTAPAPRYDDYVKAMTAAVSGDMATTDKLAKYWSYLPILLRGAWVTVYLSVTAMLLAILLGVAVAVMRLYGPRPLRWLALAYTEVIRGTPLLIQLYLLYYGLPSLHPSLSMPPILAGILGLAINYSAYEAENYRAGLQAVASHQMEAALSLGLSAKLALRHVILPQAIRVAIPSVTNDFIALFKDSSIVSVITIVELTNRSRELAGNTFDYMGIGLLTAALYFTIGLPFAMLAKRLERRMATYLRNPV